jgi:hypothetical protein
MKRIKFVIPTMILVAILAAWILEKDYSAIPFEFRILIILGGAMLSGVLTYFLFPQGVGEVDQKSDK